LADADFGHLLQMDDLNEVSNHVGQVAPQIRCQETWPNSERKADREEGQEG
jgi:hypothetical protein